MPTKKTIIESTGCTKSGAYVDGVSIEDMTTEEKNGLADYLFAKFKEEIAADRDSVARMFNLFWPSQVDDPYLCDTCDDWVNSTTWLI